MKLTADERIAVLETNERNIFHQIDEMKEEIKVLRLLATAVQQLADKTENNTALLQKVDKRLANIELQPVGDYNHYKRVIVTALVTGVLGAVLGALLSTII